MLPALRLEQTAFVSPAYHMTEAASVTKPIECALNPGKSASDVTIEAVQSMTICSKWRRGH